MNFRFTLMGIVLWAVGGALFLFRGYHPNFFILFVVGTIIIVYGLFSR